MQEQTKTSNEDWRENVSGESKATLKVQDGETEEFIFLDEGKKHHHSDFGDSVVFNIRHQDVDKNWYINPENYTLLKQIKDLGDLTNLKVKVSRTGSKKSDTRYTIVKAEGTFAGAKVEGA